MSDALPPVRPTKRCLNDLGLAFPPLEDALHEVDHPLIARSQRVPGEVEAGAGKRISSLSDRVWWKVKHSAIALRSVATKLSEDEVPSGFLDIFNGSPSLWWTGAAGPRIADSAGDFYKKLDAEAERAGKGTGLPKTSHLLPQDIDARRLKNELAARVTESFRNLVCTAISTSLARSALVSVVLEHEGTALHELGALVRAQNGGEAYLAVYAEGFVDSRIITLILGCIPGLPSRDWMAEPSDVLGINPKKGQLIYSTLIPTQVQKWVLDNYPPYTI